jgi:hypothetical protein
MHFKAKNAFSELGSCAVNGSRPIIFWSYVARVSRGGADTLRHPLKILGKYRYSGGMKKPRLLTGVFAFLCYFSGG